MTSMNNIRIKLFFTITLIINGIAFSALSISKNTQVTEVNNPTVQVNYQRKLESEIKMLIPGNKQFNQRFMKKILTHNNDNSELV